MRSTPGPLPSSCLTCRKRKTQCDKTRPACSRCLTSGNLCLGYGHIPVVESPSFYLYSGSTRHPKTPPLADSLETLSSAGSGGSKSINNHIYRHDEDFQPVVSVDSHETLPALDTAAQPSAQPRLEVAITARSTPFSDGYRPDANDCLVQPTLLSEVFVDPAKQFCLPPPKIIPDPALSGEVLEFIMSQYGSLFEGFLFKPTPVFVEMMRRGTTMRICSSALARCSIYIGARIFQTLARHGKRADLRYLRSCLHRLGEQLCIRSTNESTLDELTDSLLAGLELVLQCFLISSSQAGYTLLRNLIPIVTQVALPDFNFWSCQPGRTSISLAHALKPPNRGIYRFVLMDALASLTFGVPPLLDYDTSWPQRPVVRSDQVSLVVAAPELAPEFIMMIINISAWRAKDPGQGAPEDIWRPLEIEAWTCQRSTDVPVEAGAWGVARMAIIEGWRHAMLIYLYMGMCGVASNDPRVQSSTKQIMKLLQVVGEDWSTSSHFFVPCLLASISTPSERRRAELSDMFLNVEDTKPWMFKAMEYKPVIDHLWHGAAANGRPVRWEDYVESRRVMLCID